MASGEDKIHPGPSAGANAQGGRDERAARLAAALRQNLQRRKAQARGRKAMAAGSGAGAGESQPEAPGREE